MKRILRLIILALFAFVIVKTSTFGWRLWEKPIVSSPEDKHLAKILESHVYKLAHQIGERSVYKYDKLDEAAKYITEQFRGFGYNVEFQNYNLLGETVKNIIATSVGAERSAEIIIAGAHYDSCFNPGADDNASSIAGLLELARFISDKKTQRTIRFVAFVNEEPPFFKTRNMGSRVYAKALKARGEQIYAALILEMIGCYSDKPNSQQYPPLFGLFYPNKGNFIGVVGNLQSRRLAKRVVSDFKNHSQFPIESVVTFGFVPGVDFSDHWSFWQEGYPAVMITDTGFYRNPDYHSRSDTYEKLDYDSMASVVRGLSAVLIEMAGLNNPGLAKTSASPKLREAMFYQKLGNKEVQCRLCFRECFIPEGKRGFCRNRENRAGILYNIVHSRPSAVHLDPIEKEPQLHMLPGTAILCLGTAGCNFRCRHCHNWQLSQRPIEEMDYVYNLPPEEVVRLAQEKNAPTISFTYNDPISFYEYVYDIAKLAKAKGLRILWHSNGTLNPEPLRELLKYTDAVTIDLKGFTEEFYRKASSAELKPVLESLKIIKQQGVWLEIVNLVIPTLNDRPEDIKRMCIWIRENLGPEVPLHFSRFAPSYKLTDLPPTPIKTLEQAHTIAREVGLDYVTVGNVPGHKYNSTFCPQCRNLLIERTHFSVLSNNIEEGKCKSCGHKIPGIWK